MCRRDLGCKGKVQPKNMMPSATIGKGLKKKTVNFNIAAQCEMNPTKLTASPTKDRTLGAAPAKNLAR